MDPLTDPAPVSPEATAASESSSVSRTVEWIKTHRGLHLVVMGVLAVTSIVLAIWLAVAAHGASSRLESQRTSLIQSGTDAMAAQSAALLKLSALPLGWAMRAALLKDDFQTVDTYVQHIIREQHVTGAALIGTDGRVRLAGNRKLEKMTAAEAFPGVSIVAGQPTVATTGADVRVVVPVMGLDRRLGTLILSYEVPLPSEWGFAAH